MHTCVYIYIYIYVHTVGRSCYAHVGWDYLSNATCLMRPRLFHMRVLSCQGSPYFAVSGATFSEHLR